MRKQINMCAGKKPYRSKAEARDAITQLNRNSPKNRVKAYKCALCDFYHFGHDSKSKLDKKPKKVDGYIHKPSKHRVSIQKVKNYGRSTEN